MILPQFELHVWKRLMQVLFPLLILLGACHSGSHENSNLVSGMYAGLSDSAHYTGMNACRECHSDKYETFILTGMGQSFGPATREKSSARFDGHSVIHDEHLNFYYQPVLRNDSLYILEFRLEHGDTTYQRLEQINYIVGSGQHTNSHLVNRNGYVYQAPMTFYTQKGQWDFPPGFNGNFNSRFSRKIELECMSCHNAYPKMIPGSENKYAEVPGGIDCERCHGPGSIHIAEKKSGHLIDIQKEIDYSIVNPGKLPLDLQLDVCQRCHVQGNAVLNEGRSFFDFRPGMKLSDVMNVFMPIYKGNEDEHIMASHAERLKMSACFIRSESMDVEKAGSETDHRMNRNSLTCVTCHNPHVSVKVTDKEVFNTACKNCHHSTKANETASGNSVQTKTCSASPDDRRMMQDNCVQCHMPRNGSIDIPHVVTTDHLIRKPVTKKETEKIREFVSLTCINNRNPGKKTVGKAYLSFYEKFESNSAFLDSAKKYLDDSNADSIQNNFNSLIRWAFLREDYALVIRYCDQVGDPLQRLRRQSYANEDSWTAYRIAESYYRSGNLNHSVLYFQRAVELEPFNLDFRNKLGSAEQDLGNNEAARKEYEYILQENPDYVSAYINYGYLKLSVDHLVEEAEQLYDQALALDPDNFQALFNKAGALIYRKKKQEARIILQKLVKQNPRHVNARRLLEQLDDI